MARSETKLPSLRPFVAFAILILQVAANLTDEDGLELLESSTWVEREEQQARIALGDDVHSGSWLIGVSPYEDCGPNAYIWVCLARENLALANLPYAPEVTNALRTIASRIME